MTQDLRVLAPRSTAADGAEPGSRLGDLVPAAAQRRLRPPRAARARRHPPVSTRPSDAPTVRRPRAHDVRLGLSRARCQRQRVRHWSRGQEPALRFRTSFRRCARRDRLRSSSTRWVRSSSATSHGEAHPRRPVFSDARVQRGAFRNALRIRHCAHRSATRYRSRQICNERNLPLMRQLQLHQPRLRTHAIRVVAASRRRNVARVLEAPSR